MNGFLKNNYNILAFSTFFFMTGVMGTRPLVPQLAKELGVTTFNTGIIISLYPLLSIFFAVHIGKVIKKYGCVFLLTVNTLVGSIALLLPFFNNIISLIISQILIGICYTFYIISSQSYISREKDGAIRDNYVMKYSLGIAFGSFVGPFIGGIFAEIINVQLSFLILGLISLVSLVLSRFIIELADDMPIPNNQKNIKVLALFKIKNFRRAILISTLILIGKDTFTSFFPLLGIELGYSSSLIGIIISVNALAGIFIRWCIPFLLNRYSLNIVIITSIFFSGLFLLLIPFSVNETLLIITSFSLGLFLGIGQPLSVSVTFYSLPEMYVDQGLGVRVTANRFVQITFPLIFGLVGQLISLSSIFYITGFIFLFGSFNTRIKKDTLSG